MTGAEAVLRPAVAADGPFLLRMVAVAVNWDPARAPLALAEVAADPVLAHYAAGWPREGDRGFVAEVGGAAVGAAWLRHFPADDPGFGFLDATVPEVSIGVREGFRGRGLGGRLLDALTAEARAAGVAALSLSVEIANPAARLYRRKGYREVARDQGAITMRRDLELRGPPP